MIGADIRDRDAPRHQGQNGLQTRGKGLHRRRHLLNPQKNNNGQTDSSGNIVHREHRQLFPRLLFDGNPPLSGLHIKEVVRKNRRPPAVHHAYPLRKRLGAHNHRRSLPRYGKLRILKPVMLRRAEEAHSLRNRLAVHLQREGQMCGQRIEGAAGHRRHIDGRKPRPVKWQHTYLLLAIIIVLFTSVSSCIYKLSPILIIYGIYPGLVIHT